jgi:hypothetical protein
MEEMDLTQLSYEKWITFVFDHPLPDHRLGKAWYWREDTYFTSDDAATSVAYITRMCGDMPGLLNRFSLQQIDQGIWFTFSGYPCTPSIFNRAVPLPARIACIESMLTPYAKIVAGSTVEEMENCFQMWWDLLAMELHLASPPAESELQDAMLGTLVKILNLGDSRCEYYALHGLGHLKHPRGPEIIDDYVRKHQSELDPQQMDWLRGCRDGTLM